MNEDEDEVVRGTMIRTQTKLFTSQTRQFLRLHNNPLR